MANDILTGFNMRSTPQNKKAAASQTLNAAGGYTFEVTPLERLRRFLVLGTDGGTYYASAADLTQANAEHLLTLAETDHRAAVDMIVDVSLKGSAPRQNATLFALAVFSSFGTTEEKRHALNQLSKVARTGTMLFLFARYIEQFRGWGPALKGAVGGWYTGKTADKLAYQILKYQQREGWSHRDLLRLAHPVSHDSDVASVLKWVATKVVDEHTPKLIEGYLKAHAAANAAEVAGIVREYGLSWEMLPDHALTSSVTWDALLDNGIPQTALMRQLPRLTRLGMLPDMGGRTGEVAARLVDMERLRSGRVHPINVLIAQRTYAGGRGKGSTWTPTRDIVDALDMAFYNAFGAVTPSGKRHMLALDVSGSMGYESISGMPLTPREASAALALVTMATEKHTTVVGFTSSQKAWAPAPLKSVFGGLTPLAISPRQRLDDAIKAVSYLPFGGTDASLPMRYATAQGIEVDTFVVYTDNETWAGPAHAHQSLTAYREKTGIPAKLVVVGMTATDCTIADPNDAGSLNVAGFDSAVPQLISDFSRGL